METDILNKSHGTDNALWQINREGKIERQSSLKPELSTGEANLVSMTN